MHTQKGLLPDFQLLPTPGRSPAAWLWWPFLRSGGKKGRSAKLRRTLRPLLAAAAFALAVGPGAQASKAVPVSCGETITVDTKLANDLIDCPNKGIVIGADNITLDLNGHTIDGDGLGDHAGVENLGHDGVTIQGGSVRDFVDGVFVLFASDNSLRDLSLSNHRHVGIQVAESTDIRVQENSIVDIAAAGIFVAVSDNVQIERNSSSQNGAGIAVRLSERVRIIGNSVSGNEAGIEIFDHSDHFRIEGNSVSGNAFPGIFVEGDDNAVNRNWVSQNGEGIIVFGSRNTITDNRVADAVGCPDGCGFGISLLGGEGNLVEGNDVRRTLRDGIEIVALEPDIPTVDNVVRDNRVRDATGDGVSVATEGDGTVSGTLIERNVAVGSGDDGFDIRSMATTLTRNTANRNQDLGIEAVAGLIDGGGNKARGNGNPLQCTNIVCR